ncbi:hypothetical protein TNCV_1683781 [Trichonephila clavipes]|nr:hypothetical protein TNCV_1683781 [Trichonephila clavipes]
MLTIWRRVPIETIDDIREGKESVVDEESFGRLQTSRTPENIEKVSAVVCENACQVAEIVNGVDGADTVPDNYVQF